MNEGASACAGGKAGACDARYMPEFMWPGIVTLLVLIVGLWFLSKKKILKIPFKIVFVGWLILTICFGVVVSLHNETERERTMERAEFCRTSGNPNCEF